MSEIEYMQDIIDSPDSDGYLNRSQSLQKYGEKADVIIDIRDKLKEIREDLGNQEGLVEREKNLLKNTKDDHEWGNRYYDKTIFKHEPKSPLSHLLSFFKIKKLFSSKYGKSKITSKLLNILFDRAIFYPDMSVYALAKKIITNQQKLRPHLRKMYTAGWLDADGEEVLTPYEYNLIGELERLIFDENIYNFIIYHKQPNIALKKINSFIGYFLSINRSRDVKTILLDSVEKSLKKIVYTDAKDKQLILKITKRIKDFLNENIIDDFILPLFECAFLREFNRKMMFESINLQDIQKFEYRTSNNVKMMMYNKKNDFNNLINSKLSQIENEMNFVQSLIELKEKKVLLLDGKSMGLLENYLYLHNSEDDEAFKIRKNNIAAFVVDLCTFFKNVYEPLLFNGVNIRLREGVETIAIFGNDVFTSEITSINSSVRNCNNYVSLGLNENILTKTSLEKSESILINSINIMNDSFYSIAIKLHNLMENHEKLKSSAPFKKQLLLGDMENSFIPYHKERIVNFHASISKKYSLGNKIILDAIKECYEFAISFSLKFEYSFRNYKDSIRNNSLKDRIDNLYNLSRKLEQLQMGENVNL